MAASKYIYAIGRRKTAVATVRLYEASGPSTINGQEVAKLYSAEKDKTALFAPFVAAEINPATVSFPAKVKGGGKLGQLGAVLLGLARCISKMGPDFHTKVKKAKLLTRDPRMVERKKTGLHKARKAEQYSKR